MYKINIEKLTKLNPYLENKKFWYMLLINPISNIEWSMLKSTLKKTFGNTISLISTKKANLKNSNFEYYNRYIGSYSKFPTEYLLFTTDSFEDCLMFEDHQISNIVIMAVGIMSSGILTSLETFEYYKESDTLYFLDYIYTSYAYQYMLIFHHLYVISVYIFIKYFIEFLKLNNNNYLIYNLKFDI